VQTGDHARRDSAPVTEEQRRHNLPGQISSFLGRDAELIELRRLLQRNRLITLTGAGGVGKTRLALELAAGVVATTADAVWLAELASLAHPALVAQVVAQAAGIREEPSRPLLASLRAGLSAGRVLLVLDNCEHLLDACAQLAEHLLRQCRS
jgi:predicted ATPase